MKIIRITFLAGTLFCTQSLTIFAVTEADVNAVGKDTAAGSLFVWFLCAIAFLKISQKIDSFMSGLGINVGHTGGSMMAELMIAAKGITTAKNIAGGGSLKGGSFHAGNTSSFNRSSLMSGGLTGAVGRQIIQSAMQSTAGQGGNPLSRKAFESSLKKGGEFANHVTGAVAQGNISAFSMKGAQAQQALSSYMGHAGISNAPSYSNVEIGGGRITGTETSVGHPGGSSFGMYHADQYMAPEGAYETITTADNASWYRQYASDAVERIPYMTDQGKIAYHENIVQKLPGMPKRKERV